MLDVKIAGGQVLDGTGAPAVRADVGVTGDSITAVGDLSREPAGDTVDAAGLIVTPGFIDMHSHSDWRLFANRRAESKIRQGVTTEVVGNCGFSPAPVSDEFKEDMRGFALYVGPGMDFSWRSVKDYLRRYEDDGLALNVAQLIGHGTLRLAVMGFARRAPSPKELTRMRGLMESAMADGACGLSTGLIYAPGSYSETPEIIRDRARRRARRLLRQSHPRRRRDAPRLGRRSHSRRSRGRPAGAGEPHQGGGPAPLGQGEGRSRVDRRGAREGQDVMADVYPYTASSTTIRTLLPDSALEGGIEPMLGRLRDPAARARIRDEMSHGAVLSRGVGWDDIMIAYAPSRPEIQGLRLDEIGRRWGKDPVECAFDIIEAERGKGYVILFQLDEADLRRALVHPHVMIGSDGSSLAATGPLSEGKPHPRSYGTFPRVLGRYARDEGVLTLPAAIHKMTGMPAARLGLRIAASSGPAPGRTWSLSRPVASPDLATYEDPHRYAAGIEHVIVNGRAVVRGGEHTGNLPGRVLRPAAR